MPAFANILTYSILFIGTLTAALPSPVVSSGDIVKKEDRCAIGTYDRYSGQGEFDIIPNECYDVLRDHGAREISNIDCAECNLYE